MEKPPSVVKVEDKEVKEKEKTGQAWEAVRNIALGSMLGMGVIGGEVARELMKPQIDASEVTDNYHEGKWKKPGEKVKQNVSLRVGDNVYRTEIDSGIKIEDYRGGPMGGELNKKGILGLYADSMITEIDSKDGTKMVVLFKIVPEGMQITYQQLDAHGKILSERISRLTPESPNVLEEK